MKSLIIYSIYLVIILITEITLMTIFPHLIIPIMISSVVLKIGGLMFFLKYG